jgi:hypothetical protein
LINFPHIYLNKTVLERGVTVGAAFLSLFLSAVVLGRFGPVLWLGIVHIENYSMTGKHMSRFEIWQKLLHL